MRPLNDKHLNHYLSRLQRIGPHSARRWGTLTPSGLMAHLTRAFEISLGEYTVADASSRWTRSAPVRWLVINVLPWPRGKIKAPPSMTPAPAGEFHAERDRCEQTIRRFVEQAAAAPSRQTRNAIFGPMSLRQWMRMHARHLNHHFTQFGV